MAHQIIYLPYTIYLTDAALVAELQAATHNGGAVGAIIRAPYDPGPPPGGAAIEFSAPLQLEATPFSAPCIRSEWFGGQANFPTNVETFTRKSGGWFGVPLLFGVTKRFYWRGTFVYSGAPAGDSPIQGETQTVISQRRWADGFELPDIGEGGTGTAGPKAARAASRHVQGYGLNLDSSVLTKTHTLTESGGAASTEGWERIYVRFKRFHTAKVPIWKSAGATSATAGIEIGVLPTGQLIITNINNVGTESILATTPAIPVHTWKKLDILAKYGAAAYFKLFINNVPVVDLAVAAFAGVGLAQAQNWQSSTIGYGFANGLAWNADDWIGAEVPVLGSAVNIYPAVDWNYGSRVALIGADGFAADHSANWSGDWRLARQRPVSNATPKTFASTTAGAILSLLTDAGREVDSQANQRGYVALTVGIYSSRAAGDGTLGYKLPAGADVMAAITQAVGLQWNSVMYRPSGLLDPITPLGGLEIKHAKGAGAGASAVQALFATAEIIGVFGPEDGILEAQPDVPSGGQDALGLATITAVKADLVSRGVSLVGPCGAFEIVKRSAWAMRGSGAGLLDKPTGNNCNGYAVDVIAFADGNIKDVLIDAGGANTPTWGAGTAVDPLRYRAAIDPGDMPPVGTLPPMAGIHNAPYPHSPWSRVRTAPFSPVVIHAGTYVGTGTGAAGTGQDLPFRCPIHFLWIRPLTGSGGGIQWMASANAPHLGGQESYRPEGPVEVLIDPTFAGGAAEDDQEQRTIVRLSSDHADSNAVGVTYQFLAISDPGMRFTLGGALGVHAGTADYVNDLFNETFTAEAGFLQQETSGAGATVRLHYKGIGHAAAAISPLSTGEIASGLSFSNGTITSKSAIMFSTATQIAYLLFRRNDGSGDAGLVNVLQLASYTGDGSASRTVSLAPASGRRPMWALVVPHNAASAYRDPSHTGTTSTVFPNTANAATAITGGGVDSISVGSLLNANGIVYDVFVLPSCDATAGNGGWGLNCESIPVEPDAPFDGPWDDEPADPELEAPDAPDVEVEPGGDDTDFGDQCIVASTKIINIALSRIGVSKRVGNISTEQSTEAAVARLHYSEDLSATLRDFPWPFATRYATLTLVAGTSTVPVNGDWQYSYRAPINMMKARRIVNPNLSKRGFDPDPPQFRVGSDATGQLIYTDEVLPELEYTIRPTCAASSGDAIFRSALAWRHAASLAPVLSKDEKKATYCLQMYQLQLREATAVGSQEQQQAKDGDAEWIRGRE